MAEQICNCITGFDKQIKNSGENYIIAQLLLMIKQKLEDKNRNCMFHESLKIKLLTLLTVVIARLQFLVHQYWLPSGLVLRLFPW